MKKRTLSELVKEANQIESEGIWLPPMNGEMFHNQVKLSLERIKQENRARLRKQFEIVFSILRASPKLTWRVGLFGSAFYGITNLLGYDFIIF